MGSEHAEQGCSNVVRRPLHRELHSSPTIWGSAFTRLELPDDQRSQQRRQSNRSRRARLARGSPELRRHPGVRELAAWARADARCARLLLEHRADRGCDGGVRPRRHRPVRGRRDRPRRRVARERRRVSDQSSERHELAFEVRPYRRSRYGGSLEHRALDLPAPVPGEQRQQLLARLVRRFPPRGLRGRRNRRQRQSLGHNRSRTRRG